MAFYTVSYSETSKGWPSFFSYAPESMVGLNNYFYSFNGGNLWRHNSSAVSRTKFYGSVGGASITTVFNKLPLEAKLFKTIELEALPGAWEVFATAESPVAEYPDPDPQFGAAGTLAANQSTGKITTSEFELKEATWYGYLRNNNTDPNSAIPSSQYGLRSIKGIGIPVNPSGVGPPPFGVNGADTANCTIEFPASTPISSSISIGDFLYQTGIIGQVIAIDLATNVITINNDTVAITTLNTAVDNEFTYYVQNSAAESHGLLGHYMEVTLTNNSGIAQELFAVESDIMKSYP